MQAVSGDLGNIYIVPVRKLTVAVASQISIV